MKLEIISNTTNVKSAILDGRIINILDFGEIHKNIVESGDMKSSEVFFRSRLSTDGTLIKYGINQLEYDEICDTLSKEIRSTVF